jgi:hypothetical protein
MSQNGADLTDFRTVRRCAGKRDQAPAGGKEKSSEQQMGTRRDVSLAEQQAVVDDHGAGAGRRDNYRNGSVRVQAAMGHSFSGFI